MPEALGRGLRRLFKLQGERGDQYDPQISAVIFRSIDL